MTFLTLAEVGELLKVSPKTCSRWALADPTFPVTRLPGRVVRVDSEALARWLRARGRTPGARGAQVTEIMAHATVGVSVARPGLVRSVA